MAERYMHGHHSSVVSSHARRTAENSVAYLLPHLREGMSLLDVGCGPGTITVDLAERVAPGRVVGVDASPVALELARAVAEQRGAAVDFREDDAYALAADDGEYDVVHAHQILHHLARPVEAIREFARVAGADGIVALREVDYEGIYWWPAIPALQEWLDTFLAVGRADGGEPSAGRRLLSWSQDAGLADIRPSSSLWLFATPADRAWWGDSWAQRATESAFAENALAQGVTDRAGLERIADGWREWAAAPDGWLSMPHAEILARGVST